VPPQTHYARAGDLHIAYQVVGRGPIDVTFIDQWWSNIDSLWRVPPFARFIERLATFARVILLDKRGTGLSDPVPFGGLPTLEEWMDDLTAVLDATGSRQTAILSGVGASYLALLFSATYPERTSALALVDGYARLSPAEDYVEIPEVFTEAHVEEVRAGWGQGVLMRRLAPDEVADQTLMERFAEYERQSASPGMAAAMLRMLYTSDVRHVLPAIRVPTLVITHKDSARIPPECSRYLAEHIAGARAVELPGSENLIWAGDQAAVVDLVEEFFTGTRSGDEPDRVLATVLFSDIVGSTELAATLGDRRWKELLDRHDELSETVVARFRGRIVDRQGDGFLATFDGPARAIRCALELRDGMKTLGIKTRAGLHTGEIERRGSDIGGIAVHIGARVSAVAGAEEVLVSRTVVDLVAGSEIRFLERGEHQLKGVPGSWTLFSVA
jgi:class 3 adenylate cyclase